MNPKAKEYIVSKRNELEEIKSSDRESFLIEQELYDKKYAPGEFGIDHSEYPYSERKEDGSSAYYKIIPIDLTDKEYEEVYAAYKAVEDELENTDEDISNSANGMAVFMIVVSVSVYIVGLVVGIVLGKNLGYYSSFEWISASICWFAGFVYGSLFLGVSEVIKLLHRQCD